MAADPVDPLVPASDLYLDEVADRIIEMHGACSHDWLVGVAHELKRRAKPLPASVSSGDPWALGVYHKADCDWRFAAADGSSQRCSCGLNFWLAQARAEDTARHQKELEALEVESQRIYAADYTAAVRRIESLRAALAALVAAVERDDNPRDQGHFSGSDEMKAAKAALAACENR